MDYLADQIRAKGGRILLSQIVTAAEVTADGVQIRTVEESFDAKHAIIAMPLGILQHADSFQLQGRGIAHYATALQSLGFGDVIKFLLKFKRPFWEESYPDLGFLLSSAPIPTWWTQLPVRSNMITGWLGGRSAKTHSQLTDAQLRDLAITSIAQIFSRDKETIESLLETSQVVNWSTDPFTLGSYAYATVGYKDALQILCEPVNGRLFFAGEYMYSGAAMGTVEAALWSGREVAKKLNAH
jgi:monoamine oxidase